MAAGRVDQCGGCLLGAWGRGIQVEEVRAGADRAGDFLGDRERVRRRDRGQAQPGPAIPTAEAIPKNVPERAVAVDAESPDLLGESTQAKWFVRPPTGGQYGPADAVLFRTWILEGRVTADSHIWREGWADWQLAEDLLAQFEGQSLLQAATTEALADSDAAIPTIVPTMRVATTPSVYRQRRATRSTMMVVILLALSCAVLFAALIYVVRYMK